MSELMNARNSRNGHRRSLMATASALALLNTVYGADRAIADDDTGHTPVVWVELGGQLERNDEGQQEFLPPFMSPLPSFVTRSPIDVEKPLGYSNGAEGKLSFTPEGSEWVFAASVRYGRSNGDHRAHESLYVRAPSDYFFDHYVHLTKLNPRSDFDDITTSQTQNHIIADFQAGRDVGLGLFGADSRATISMGVRFAQLNSKSDVEMKARPDLQYYNEFPAPRPLYIPLPRFHNFEFYGHATRSVHAIGPSLSWDAQSRVAGNPNGRGLTIDWGMNAAILFGRQKAYVSHSTTGGLYQGTEIALATQPPATHYQHSTIHNRTHSVVVPNIGGFAGVSLRWPNAKVSLGYRADFFFGAMDGGIDAAKKENRGFYGPFANLSIGLGG